MAIAVGVAVAHDAVMTTPAYDLPVHERRGPPRPPTPSVQGESRRILLTLDAEARFTLVEVIAAWAVPFVSKALCSVGVVDVLIAIVASVVSSTPALLRKLHSIITSVCVHRFMSPPIPGAHAMLHTMRHTFLHSGLNMRHRGHLHSNSAEVKGSTPYTATTYAMQPAIIIGSSSSAPPPILSYRPVLRPGSSASAPPSSE